jgi:hypothetical protein
VALANYHEVKAREMARKNKHLIKHEIGKKTRRFGIAKK